VEEHRATIARIESEAGRMARIVEGLLALARADARSAPASAEDVDLAVLLESSVRRLTPRAIERGVRIEARVDRGLAVADRDAGLERVFDNLLDNALRYAPDGSAVEIEAKAHERKARVTVADHGPGIPPPERTRVFERFHRSPGASGTGAGLGLAIVREIVDAHGGSISVSETPGGGATFVVELVVARR
jgi:signal transduction histidine kinase